MRSVYLLSAGLLALQFGYLIVSGGLSRLLSP
jgi:hypothetical protein